MRDEENSVDSNSADKNDDFQGFGKDGGDSSTHENLDKSDDFQGFGGEDSQSAPVENGKKSLGFDDLLDALAFTPASPIVSGLRGAARLAGGGGKTVRAAEGVGKARREVGVGSKGIFSGLGSKILDAETKAGATKSVSTLPSNIQRKVKNFFKGGSNSYNDFSVEIMKNGNYMAKMIKPGNVPGSKAIYYKEINPSGNTIRVFKETYNSTGKLVSIKVKKENI